MSKELLSMNVCPYCKKIKGNTKIDFFNHMIKCETMDHRDSPITTTWYTIEELEKPKIKRKESIEVKSSFRPVTR